MMHAHFFHSVRPEVKLYGHRYAVEHDPERIRRFQSQMGNIGDSAIFRRFLIFAIGEQGASDVMAHDMTCGQQLDIGTSILSAMLGFPKKFIYQKFVKGEMRDG